VEEIQMGLLGMEIVFAEITLRMLLDYVNLATKQTGIELEVVLEGLVSVLPTRPRLVIFVNVTKDSLPTL
jgi:hypothetical protein